MIHSKTIVQDHKHCRYKTGIMLTIFAFLIYISPVARAYQNQGAREKSNESNQFGYFSLIANDTLVSHAQLLSLLSSPDPQIRQYSVTRLTETDEADDSTVGAVVRLLADTNEDVRLQTVAGLIRLGSRATKILAKELSDTRIVGKIYTAHTSGDDPGTIHITVSDLAFTALLYGNSVDGDALLNQYKPSPASTKKKIVELLYQLPIRATPALHKALYGSETELAIAAMSIIVKTDSNAKKIIPGLVNFAVKGPDQMRRAAIVNLANMAGPGHTELRRLIHASNPKTRRLAISVYPYTADSAAFVFARSLKERDVRNQLVALNRLQEYEYESDSVFEASLPNTVVTDIAPLLKSKFPKIRLAAVRSLGSIGLIREDYAQVIADKLLTMIAGRDAAVRLEAVSQIDDLRKDDIFPRSKNAIRILLNALIHSQDEDETAELLDIISELNPVELPASVLSKLINICLTKTDEWDDRPIVSFIKSKPAWTNRAMDRLLKENPAPYLLDQRKTSLILRLAADNPAHINTLKLFLEHPIRSIRGKAALSLCNMGVLSDQVLSMLEDEIRTAYSQDAINALLAVNPRGIERLIAVVRDSTINDYGRSALLYGFRDAIGKNKEIAGIILSYAKDTSNARMQMAAISLLDSITNFSKGVKAALQLAFLSKSESIRRSVIDIWAKRKFEPDDLVDRVMNDNSAQVRKQVFDLVNYLPPDDIRRVRIVKAALDDPEKEVRDNSLFYAGRLGDAGNSMVKNYVKSGRTFDQYLFHIIQGFKPLGDSFITVLESRQKNATQEERAYIDKLLGNASHDTLVDRTKLYQELTDNDEDVRNAAARTLLSLGEDPWGHKGIIAAVLMQEQVKRIVKEHLKGVLDELDLDKETGMSYRLEKRLLEMGLYGLIPGRAYDESDRALRLRFHHKGNVPLAFNLGYDPPDGYQLPSFPWPPPPGYKMVLIPYDSFPATKTTTLGGIYKALTGALNACSHDFEYSLFGGPPHGYALIARIEHIEDNGAPLPEPKRWTKEGSSRTDFFSFLGDLFFERPGYFRIITFAVTDDLSPGQNRYAQLPELSDGSAGMPDSIGKLPRTNQQVMALIYTFELNSSRKIIPWLDGAPSARQHLEKAGVWVNFNK